MRDAARDMGPVIFFYGSLRDEELLALVIGRPDLDGIERRPAFVKDRRIGRVAGQSFPMLFEAPGEKAEGVVVIGLTPEECDRLDFFEDGDYAITPLSVETEAGPLQAFVYAPTGRLRDSGEPWDLEAWRARDKPLLIECAREQMSYFGRVDRALVELWWPDIEARAEARLGRRPTIRSDFARGDVQQVSMDVGYRDYFQVEDHVVRHRVFDGGSGPEVKRAALISGEAAIVLPFDPIRNEVVLIEQWRVGPWSGGDENPWTIETVAGRIEDGETPEDVARREALEEAGVTLKRLEPFPALYSTPGICAERFHAFIGEADLSEAGGVHGLAEEGEDIRVLRLDFWEAMTALARGDVNSCPAALGLLWLARNRDRLLLKWR